MNKILLILLTLFAPLASAADDWTGADKALGATTLTAIIIDWGQTRHVAKNPNLYHEKNQFLSKSPTMGDVNKHFATALVGTALIAHALPSEYRKLFLGGVLVVCWWSSWLGSREIKRLE